MIMKTSRRAALVVTSMLCALAVVQPAKAQSLTAPNSPSDQNEWKGATTGLGASHRFATLVAAQNHCGTTDTVVWTDGYHLTYDLPGSPDYGKTTTKYGFYACKSEADNAGFKPAGE